jgi:hypothetical protein
MFHGGMTLRIQENIHGNTIEGLLAELFFRFGINSEKIRAKRAISSLKIWHQAPMQVLLLGKPWERISVDITEPHPRSCRGKSYILTLVDFSKWAEAIPISNHTAPTVASALMDSFQGLVHPNHC